LTAAPEIPLVAPESAEVSAEVSVSAFKSPLIIAAICVETLPTAVLIVPVTLAIIELESVEIVLVRFVRALSALRLIDCTLDNAVTCEMRPAISVCIV
jgi:hypothetical protein